MIVSGPLVLDVAVAVVIARCSLGCALLLSLFQMDLLFVLSVCLLLVVLLLASLLTLSLLVLMFFPALVGIIDVDVVSMDGDVDLDINDCDVGIGKYLGCVGW